MHYPPINISNSSNGGLELLENTLRPSPALQWEPGQSYKQAHDNLFGGRTVSKWPSNVKSTVSLRNCPRKSLPKSNSLPRISITCALPTAWPLGCFTSKSTAPKGLPGWPIAMATCGPIQGTTESDDSFTRLGAMTETAAPMSINAFTATSLHRTSQLPYG